MKGDFSVQLARPCLERFAACTHRLTDKQAIACAHALETSGLKNFYEGAKKLERLRETDRFITVIGQASSWEGDSR